MPAGHRSKYVITPTRDATRQPPLEAEKTTQRVLPQGRRRPQTCEAKRQPSTKRRDKHRPQPTSTRQATATPHTAQAGPAGTPRPCLCGPLTAGKGQAARLDGTPRPARPKPSPWVVPPPTPQACGHTLFPAAGQAHSRTKPLPGRTRPPAS